MSVTTRIDRDQRVRRVLVPSPLRKVVLVGAVVLAIAVVAAVGSRRVPCGPDSGTALQTVAARNSDARLTLRVATFNIHGGKGEDDVRDLTRTADCLRTFDLVGLNEVHGACLGRGENQAAQLARLLECDWLFAPTEERWWHYRFGNGLLSRMSVAHWQRIPLRRVHGKSFRNLVLTEVELQGRSVRVLTTHIDRSDDRERAEQLRTAGQLFLSLAEPAILMGDMNSPAADPNIRRLLRISGVHDPLTDVLGDEAPPRIDWIFTRGLQTVDAGVIDTGASDHPCVWAELALPN